MHVLNLVPVITNSVGGYISMTYWQMVTPPSSYQVTAMNLTDNLIISTNTDYSDPNECQLEVSLSPDDGYAASLILTPDNGTVNSTIYVRAGCTDPPFTTYGTIIQSSMELRPIFEVVLEMSILFICPCSSLGQVVAQQGSEVVVPLNVMNMEETCVGGYYIDFDSRVLIFNGIGDLHPQFANYYAIQNNCTDPWVCLTDPYQPYLISDAITVNDTISRVIIRWNMEINMGGWLQITEGTLMNLYFSYLGGTSQLTFTYGYYDYSGNGSPLDPVIINEPFENYYFNGSVGPPPPVISVSLANNTLITYNQMVTPATPYQVSATNLTNDLVIDVSALSGYPEGCQSEISLLPDQAFSAQLVISPVNGMIDTTIYVMPNFGTPCYTSCNLIHSSNNAGTITRRITIENIFSYHFAPVVTIPDVHAIPGSLINVPVMVENFEDAGVGYYTIEFDPTVLTYSGLENVNPGLMVENCPDCNDPEYCLYQTDKICSEVTVIDPNHSRINIHYYHEAISPGMLDIPDGVTLFELAFNYSGGYSALTFTDGSYLYSGNGIPTDPVIIMNPLKFYPALSDHSKTVTGVNLEGLLERRMA